MATVTGLTAERMIEIEAASVIGGTIVGDNLILTKFDASTIDSGSVRGPQGPMGLGPGMIPGEIRMWSGSGLPDPDDYNTWVWANGAAYVIADHPLAAGYIDDAWNTFDGASAPAAGSFRVPDLRGLVPAGLDQMPSGARANRMTRSVAIIIAGKTGEETHIITVGEMPAHLHGGGDHDHQIMSNGNINQPGNSPSGYANGGDADLSSAFIENSGAIITAEGDDDAHENIQPTVMIPYIVCLDG